MRQEHITSRQNPLLVHIRKLQASRSYRKASGEFAAEGTKLLEEAAKWYPGLHTVVCREGLRLCKLPEQVRVVTVPEDVFKSISTVDTPQGVVGRFDEPLYALAGDDMYGLLLEARRHADVKECYPFGQTHHLIAGEGFDAGRFVRETTARGFRRVTLRPVGAGIEDVFIKLMRHA